MAQYNWDELKKEFIIGDYKSLNEFADIKGLTRNGNFNKKTKGWAEEKATKEQQKGNKIIDKTIEKVAEKEANRNARILSLADRLADKVDEAINQLEQYVITNKKKTKTVEYDNKSLKPTREVTVEEEIKDIIDGLIDKQGLKTLTAALKDIKDINTDKLLIETNNKNDNTVRIKLEGDLKEWAK